jgi:hypothetical protein
MTKLFNFSMNFALLIFLGCLLFLPISSMTMLGLKPENKNVLSAEDQRISAQEERILELEKELETLKQTTVSKSEPAPEPQSTLNR